MLSVFLQSWTRVLVLTPPPQAVSLGKRMTSLRLSFIIGKISELAWMSSVHPSSSSFQWVSSSSYFFCKHLENSDCAAKSESRYTWAHVHLFDTIQGRCSGDSACALTPDKRKEKAHATVSLAVSLLSQVIWITAWPILWTVKKNTPNVNTIRLCHFSQVQNAILKMNALNVYKQPTCTQAIRST